MDNVNFNTPAGSKPERNTLILYLNTGTAQEPVWSAVGLGVEESSMEYDWSEKTERDILGNVRTTIKKPKITQKFEPCKAHRLTDEKLEEMEKRLSAIYSRAEYETRKRG